MGALAELRQARHAGLGPPHRSSACVVPVSAALACAHEGSGHLRLRMRGWGAASCTRSSCGEELVSWGLRRVGPTVLSLAVASGGWATACGAQIAWPGAFRHTWLDCACAAVLGRVL